MNDNYLWDKARYHIYLDFIGPIETLIFFNYYYTIFKLLLFQYDTSLSNNFCGIIDQCRLDLKQPSFMTARVH